MITIEMFGKVRRMFFRDGKSRSEIARRTGLSRTTIKKWVKVPLGTEPKYQRASKPGKLSEFKDELVRALKADATDRAAIGVPHWRCFRPSRPRDMLGGTRRSRTLSVAGTRVAVTRLPVRLFRCNSNQGKRTSLTGAKNT